MKIDRLLGLLSILANTDKITVQELASRFEVSKRTIFRDLDALSRAGIPIFAWIEQKYNAVLPLVDYAVKRHIPVGAICNAANFMAENGYLDSIGHSGNTLDFMKSQAPHYLGENYFIRKQAVCDSNIITANGSGALEFAKEILLLLKAKPEKSILEWYNLNKHGFYPG